MRRHRPAALAVLLVPALAGLPSTARAQLVARQTEPVVLSGADLPAWSRLAATTVCAPYPSGTTGGRDAHNGTTVVPPDGRARRIEWDTIEVELDPL